MEKVTLKCDVMYKDKKVGRLEVVDGKLIKNEVYTKNILEHPFPKHNSFGSIEQRIKDRVICESRYSEEIKESLGGKEYSIYTLFRDTHGVDVDDFIWFKFDGENLCWDDVRAR